MQSELQASSRSRKAALLESQNEDQKPREKKLQRERSVHDINPYRHEYRGREKSKERTRERERFKSSERDRDKRRERDKEQQREDRERHKDKVPESWLEERHSALKYRDRDTDRERDKKHRTYEIIDPRNYLKSFEGRDTEHHRRREIRHHLEEEKTRAEERERRHKVQKDNDLRKQIEKFLAYKIEEGECVRKLEKHQELDKERERKYREKKEHSSGTEKERLSTEKSYKHYGKEEEEKHKTKRSKEKSSHGDREGSEAEADERVKSREKERKKYDLKSSEYKKEERIQEEMSHQLVRTVKDKGKLIETEDMDTRQEEMKDTHISNPDTEFKDFSLNYEDDFEVYEDDFEDDEDKSSEVEDAEENLREVQFSRTSEIEEIQRAITEENDRIFNPLPKKLENEKKEPVMVSFSLLDLPPVNEYDMYIRNFGKMNTKQAYVQCNEDNLDRDIQTEEVETLEKWTQHPGESALVSGGPINSQNTSVNGAPTPKIDSQRLANFLRSACQAEKSPACMSPKFRGRQCSLLMDYLKRQVLIKPLIFIIISTLHAFTVLQVMCCCFSPSKATLVFAGTADGSLLVWDLREDSRMHPCMMISETEWTFRVPTFSTEMSSPPFQIASMDENGILNMWVVVELQKADLAGSQTDLGLVPGGKVKLVHSSTMELSNSLFPKDISQRMPQTLTIKFLSSNPNHFIVGTNIVGCSDGSIRLHQMTSEHPLMQWNGSTKGQPIIALQWALTRPAVFFALDASSNIYIWDLLENDLLPVAKQTMPSERVVTMTLLGEPEKANGLLGIVLAKESGHIDIQYVKKKWALPRPEESEKLYSILLQSF
ncbi:hypothetical protein EK904_008070 [Melospiza melodia maxima]|nr:hypothetical protein EK904_008070 [Melospiza melodia maxima]